MALPLDEPDATFVIVRTKLMTPSLRTAMVARPQLLETLQRGRSAKLILVCAPPGWGKTSLLAQWIASDQRAFAWVSFDSGDDEPLRYWRYVVAAMMRADPALADTAQRRLGAPVVSIADEILPVLVNDLTELPRSLVLVLDDHHLIASPEIYAQLGYLLDRLPPNVQIVLAAQHDPPLRLGQLRAKGELVELRGEQLRFGDYEAAALLNQIHGLELDPDDVAVVQRRTEGWAAGLNLFALSLKRGGDRERILEAAPADDRFLVDYLWHEVVLSQPEPVQQFLMRTSILERFTGPLCNAVTERADSEEILRELDRGNLFVVPLDPDHRWFRYHHLFRTLLRAQLERTSPELIPDLHRRASTWFAENGLMIEAIDDAITAGDFNYAADELERHWLEFYSAGQVNVLLSWIDRLPDDAIDAHPALALARAGVARSVGRTDEFEAWLTRAEQSAADTPARGMASTIAGGAALARSMYCLAMGDVPAGVAWARRAMELEPDEHSRERMTAGYFLGVTLFYDDPDQAQPFLRNFLAAVPDGQEDVRRYYAMALLAEVYGLRGEPDVAEQLARQALVVTHRQGLEEHPPTEQVHVALGIAPLARDELEVAEDQFERAVALALRGGDRLEYAHALLWLARVRARYGDISGGRDAVRAAREAAPEAGRSALAALVQTVELELGQEASVPHPPQEDEPLSDAELRVLRLLVGDLSYREIASHLHLSLNTVRAHSLRLRRKLGVSNRAETVARARENGLL